MKTYKKGCKVLTPDGPGTVKAVFASHRWVDLDKGKTLALYTASELNETYKPKKKRAPSRLEMAFAKLWDAQAAVFHPAPLPKLDAEYRFDPARKWRADCAIPNQKILFEMEGGTWSNGRHSRGAGYSADCKKYNAGAMSGWRIIRLTSDMITPAYVRTLAEWVMSDETENNKHTTP